MKLKLVQVLFRHGERTPLKSEYNVLKVDPSIYQPFGVEQLTNTGKKQAYTLGRMLRERYKDFVSEKYVSHEIYSYASDTDRTKGTLELVLAALFPPRPELTWDPDLNWSPIPFNCIPKELDLLLNGYRNPNYLAMRDLQYNSREFKKIMSENVDFIKLVNEQTTDDGDDRHTSKDTFRKVYALFNLSRIHERMNLPLPDWYTPEFKDTLFKIFLCILEIKSLTLEMKKVNSGPILKKILNSMTSTDKKQSLRKLHLYSGHDLNIAATLQSLKIKGAKFSDFASALIFEKYEDSDNQIYVKVFYWQTVGEEMTQLKLNGCDGFCHIDEFTKLVSDVVPTDDEMQKLLCHLDPKRLISFCLERS